METAMAGQRRTDPRFSLEVGFEPRRDGQTMLTQAYQRLLPTLSRPIRPAPVTRMREGEDDATAASNGFDTGPARDADPGSDLRPGVLRPAS